MVPVPATVRMVVGLATFIVLAAHEVIAAHPDGVIPHDTVLRVPPQAIVSPTAPRVSVLAPVPVWTVAGEVSLRVFRVAQEVMAAHPPGD